MRGISTDIPCTNKAVCIKQAGYDFVFRYYAEHTGNPAKVLKPDEAAALAMAGLKIGVVFQNRRSGNLSYFTRSAGRLDGAYAHRYAQQMRQPAGSGIYFGVDCDPEPGQLPGLIPDYFEGVLAGFNSVSNNQPLYDIGVYGSGLVCAWLRTHLAFVKYSWLAKPRLWHGRETYHDWSVKQFDGPGPLCEMTGGALGQWELNDTNNDDFGQFVPEAAEG
jgi:hypothetical protein